jgi:hypothetical protein
MGRYLLRPFLVPIASLACAQTTGSGPTVLQNAATLNPQVFSQVRYANEFSGSDLGAQINAAASSLGTSGGVVKIPRGAYSWSTLVTIDPRIVSIVGDGSPFVTISCTASECLKLNEPTFSISQGGYIGGFTLPSNGSAGRTGFAMKGTDRMRMTGAIVGKAVGALNQGVGIVPVLVMLQ